MATATSIASPIPPGSSIATSTYPIPALTTIFKPPSDCWSRKFTYPYDPSAERLATDVVELDLYLQYYESKSSGKISCYPNELMTDTLWEHMITFSPGVCPEGYKTFGTSSSSIGGTFAFCCPPGFTLTKGEDYWNMVTCSSTIGSRITVVWNSEEWTISGTVGSTDDPILDHWSTATISVNSARATPIIAIWRDVDLPHFTPASAPILGLAEKSLTALNITDLYTPPRTTTPVVSTAPYSTFPSGHGGADFSDARYTPWTPPPPGQVAPTTTSGSRGARCTTLSRFLAAALVLAVTTSLQCI